MRSHVQIGSQGSLAAPSAKQHYDQEHTASSARKDEMASLKHDVQDVQNKLKAMSNTVSQTTKDMQDNVARGLAAITRGMEVVQENLRKEVEVRESSIEKLSSQINETLNKAATKLNEELMTLSIEISAVKTSKDKEIRGEMLQLKDTLSKETHKLTDSLHEFNSTARNRELELAKDLCTLSTKLASAVSASEFRQEAARIEGLSTEATQNFETLQTTASRLTNELAENSQRLMVLESSSTIDRTQRQLLDTEKADKADVVKLDVKVDSLSSQYEAVCVELTALQRDYIQTSSEAGNMQPLEEGLAQLKARIDKVCDSLPVLEANDIERQRVLQRIGEMEATLQELDSRVYNVRELETQINKVDNSLHQLEAQQRDALQTLETSITSKSESEIGRIEALIDKVVQESLSDLEDRERTQRRDALKALETSITSKSDSEVGRLEALIEKVVQESLSELEARERESRDVLEASIATKSDSEFKRLDSRVDHVGESLKDGLEALNDSVMRRSDSERARLEPRIDGIYEALGQMEVKESESRRTLGDEVENKAKAESLRLDSRIDEICHNIDKINEQECELKKMLGKTVSQMQGLEKPAGGSNRASDSELMRLDVRMNEMWDMVQAIERDHEAQTIAEVATLKTRVEEVCNTLTHMQESEKLTGGSSTESDSELTRLDSRINEVWKLVDAIEKKLQTEKTAELAKIEGRVDEVCKTLSQMQGLEKPTGGSHTDSDSELMRLDSRINEVWTLVQAIEKDHETKNGASSRSSRAVVEESAQLKLNADALHEMHASLREELAFLRENVHTSQHSGLERNDQIATAEQLTLHAKELEQLKSHMDNMSEQYVSQKYMADEFVALHGDLTTLMRNEISLLGETSESSRAQIRKEVEHVSREWETSQCQIRGEIDEMNRLSVSSHDQFFNEVSKLSKQAETSQTQIYAEMSMLNKQSDCTALVTGVKHAENSQEQIRSHLTSLSTRAESAQAQIRELSGVSAQTASSHAQLHGEFAALMRLTESSQALMNELQTEFQTHKLREKQTRTEVSQKMNEDLAQREIKALRHHLDTMNTRLGNITDEVHARVTSADVQRLQTSAQAQASQEIYMAVEKLISEKLVRDLSQRDQSELSLSDLVREECTEMKDFMQKSRLCEAGVFASQHYEREARKRDMDKIEARLQHRGRQLSQLATHFRNYIQDSPQLVQAVADVTEPLSEEDPDASTRCQGGPLSPGAPMSPRETLYRDPLNFRAPLNAGVSVEETSMEPIPSLPVSSSGLSRSDHRNASERSPSPPQVFGKVFEPLKKHVDMPRPRPLTFSDMPLVGQTWSFCGNVASIAVYSSADATERLKEMMCWDVKGKMRRIEIVQSVRLGTVGDHRVNFRCCDDRTEGWLPMFDENGKWNIERRYPPMDQQDCTFA